MMKNNGEKSLRRWNHDNVITATSTAPPCNASADSAGAARLDNIRCLSFNVKRNPLVYITNTLERYVPIAEASGNQRLYALATAIRSEANTFLG